MSSILISTAIFGLLGVAGTAIYVALYGSHRVFQERFSEMAIKLKLAEGDGLFAVTTSPKESPALCSNGPCSECRRRRRRRRWKR
jgi:hypothetical protein